MDDERERLLIQAAQQSDRAAVDELLNAHMGLIHMLARRFHTSTFLEEELVQAGYIGFMTALQRYQSEYRTRLITYAVPWIIGEMKKTLRNAESQKALISYDVLEQNQQDAEPEPNAHTRLFTDDIDLKWALEKLKKEDQLLVYLRYFRDKTQKETALLLNKSQSQISKSEKRILDCLRCQLA